MPPQPPPTRTGLARAMSKLGFCSRSRATELIRMGKVKVLSLIHIFRHAARR